MAKNRLINTKFWDDQYVTKLDPSEKLLFLYFLTNTQTTVLGIYPIELRRISFDTGLEQETVLRILDRFTKAEKIFYFNGYIILKNFVKNQYVNPNIKKGIERELSELPTEIIAFLAKNETLSKSFEHFGILNLTLPILNLTKPIPNGGESKAIKPKRDDQPLVEYYFKLKGWDTKPKKELNAVFPRYLKVAKQVLELTSLEDAKAKMLRLKTWAENNELDWSFETMIKKWMDLDELPQQKKVKAFIDGDRAYQRGDEWFVILANGEHKKYIGAMNKLHYE